MKNQQSFDLLAKINEILEAIHMFHVSHDTVNESRTRLDTLGTRVN